ncbi:hypothetical protein ACJX0J_014495 [Zea mays]
MWVADVKAVGYMLLFRKLLRAHMHAHFYAAVSCYSLNHLCLHIGYIFTLIIMSLICLKLSFLLDLCITGFRTLFIFSLTNIMVPEIIHVFLWNINWGDANEVFHALFQTQTLLMQHAM